MCVVSREVDESPRLSLNFNETVIDRDETERTRVYAFSDIPCLFERFPDSYDFVYHSPSPESSAFSRARCCQAPHPDRLGTRMKMYCKLLKKRYYAMVRWRRLVQGCIIGIQSWAAALRQKKSFKALRADKLLHQVRCNFKLTQIVPGATWH